MRERRTPVNMENQLHRDNGEGVAQRLPLTHFEFIFPVTQGGARFTSLALGYYLSGFQPFKPRPTICAEG